MIPSGSSPSPGVQDCVRNIKVKLAKLEEFISERENILKEAIKCSETDDISSNLISGERDSQTIMEDELKKYEEFKSDINQNVEQQSKLFQEIYVRLNL